MSTDPNSQPSQDDVFAASLPFATAGDGFAVVDALNPMGPRLLASPYGNAPPAATCLDVHASLGVYLDGELAPAQSAGIRQHLASCGSCQTAQAFQMQYRSTLATKAFDPMPDDVRARITKALGFE